jgi:hypothetical protein
MPQPFRRRALSLGAATRPTLHRSRSTPVLTPSSGSSARSDSSWESVRSPPVVSLSNISPPSPSVESVSSGSRPPSPSVESAGSDLLVEVLYPDEVRSPSPTESSLYTRNSPSTALGEIDEPVLLSRSRVAVLSPAPRLSRWGRERGLSARICFDLNHSLLALSPEARAPRLELLEELAHRIAGEGPVTSGPGQRFLLNAFRAGPWVMRRLSELSYSEELRALSGEQRGQVLGLMVGPGMTPGHLVSFQRLLEQLRVEVPDLRERMHKLVRVGAVYIQAQHRLREASAELPTDAAVNSLELLSELPPSIAEQVGRFSGSASARGSLLLGMSWCPPGARRDEAVAQLERLGGDDEMTSDRALTEMRTLGEAITAAAALQDREPVGGWGEVQRTELSHLQGQLEARRIRGRELSRRLASAVPELFDGRELPTAQERVELALEQLGEDRRTGLGHNPRSLAELLEARGEGPLPDGYLAAVLDAPRSAVTLICEEPPAAELQHALLIPFAALTGLVDLRLDLVELLRRGLEVRTPLPELAAQLAVAGAAYARIAAASARLATPEEREALEELRYDLEIQGLRGEALAEAIETAEVSVRATFAAVGAQGIDRENVQNTQRMSAARTSATKLLQRFDKADRDPALAEVKALVQSLAAVPGSRLGRTRAGATEEANAIRVLEVERRGADLSGPLSANDPFLEQNDDLPALGLGDLAALVLRAIDAWPDERERENMKHSLVTGLSQCIEDSGDQVCPVGVSQRLLSVLQGYYAEVELDIVDPAKLLTALGALFAEQHEDPDADTVDRFFEGAMREAVNRFGAGTESTAEFEAQLREYLKVSHDWV